MAERVLMKGNEAIAEAAIRAGCRHYFGYPITPQTEVAAYMAKKMPKIGGVFLQAESEIASINMVYGAAAAGMRVMTSSSSPGISLKSEGLSYIAGSDVPAFVVEEIAGDDGLAQTVLDATELNIPAYSMASYEDVLAEIEEEGTIIYTELIDFEQDGSPELLVIHRRDNSDGISILRNGPDGPQHLHGWGSGTHTAETYSLVESDGKLFVRRLSYSGPYSDGDYGYFDEYCGPTAQSDGGRESWGMTDYLQISFHGNGSLKASWVKSHNDKGFVDLEGDYDYNVSYLDVQGKYTLVRELVSFEGENPS